MLYSARQIRSSGTMMQKRFSASDIILFITLFILVTLLLSLMYQVDRQWKELKTIQTNLSAQTQELQALRTRAVQTPVAVTTPTTTPITASVSSTSSTTAVSAPTPVTSTTKKELGAAFQRAVDVTKKPDYAEGDWYVDSFGQDLKTLTPLVSSDAYASRVQNYIFESLISRDPDTLEWQGFIATSWTVSPDGLTITFKMRDDVTFADGVPMTAEDVVFSYDFIMNEGIAAARTRSYLDKIKSVKALDKYTVEFVYKEPYFEALELAGTMSIMPKHFYAPYLAKTNDFNQSKAILLGSGPYKMPDNSNWSPDKGTIELVRNERYWGLAPSFNRIMWRTIKNDSARLTTYRNGEIDLYGSRPKEYQTLKADPQITNKSQNFEYMSPVAGYSYIAWNQERDGKPTFFADKRVRQAMTLITDRERIIKDVYLGYGEIAVSPFSPTSKQHNPTISPWDYNVARAQELLKEAGFSDSNNDGVLDKDGKPLEFKLTYAESNEDTKRMVLLLKDLYAKAGVRLIPFPQEWPVMIESMDKRTYDAITLAWTSGIEIDVYQMFHSSQIKDGGDNFMSYRSPELDKLVEEARKTVDESKRMPLWQQVEKILHEDQPYTFLARGKSLLFIDKRIQNLQMTKVGLNASFVPGEIYVPKPMQRYSQ